MKNTKYGPFATIMALLLLTYSNSTTSDWSKSNYLLAKEYHRDIIARQNPETVIAALPRECPERLCPESIYEHLQRQFYYRVNTSDTDVPFMPLSRDEKAMLKNDSDLREILQKLAQRIQSCLANTTLS